jgi:hypothetical protein
MGPEGPQGPKGDTGPTGPTGPAGVSAALTFNNGGTGAGSGTSYNGTAARTISYNTIGAAPASHTHDDRYYTEGEVNSLLGNKSNTDHEHSYIV